ncbi:MAG: hypothetical protein Q7R52_03665 [archaeon]|nr:hypothetical protein [archaeon]
MIDPLIIINLVLVFITGIYAFLTYKILKSNEKIAKLNLDPILWVNLFTEGGVYIKKLRKYPAYNVTMEFYIKTLFPKAKEFYPIAFYKLGNFIEEENDFCLDFEEKIEEYFKKRNIKKSKFMLRYIIKYSTGIDKSFIKREDHLLGNAEEVDDGEIALVFYDSENDFDDLGKSPKEAVYFK